jgi:hypothetical protein
MTEQTQKYSIQNQNIRVTVQPGAENVAVTIDLRSGERWTPTLAAEMHPSLFNNSWPFNGARGTWKSILPSVVAVETTATDGASTLKMTGASRLGTFTHTFTLADGDDWVDVAVIFHPTTHAILSEIEDRWEFLPEKRTENSHAAGPLDLVWSQNIKKEPKNVCSHQNFKSPVVMFQQGRLFAAIVPNLEGVTRQSLERMPLALDLDVTSGPRPWFGYGIIPALPAVPNNVEDPGHSLFVRTKEILELRIDEPRGYAYRLLVSDQPEGQGYHRAVAFLWEKIGRPELMRSVDLQQNVHYKDLYLFDDWRRNAWEDFAGCAYHAFDYDGAPCGLLTSWRGTHFSRTFTPWDGWFHTWMQSLRTAYGWYLYGKRTGNSDIQQKAETVVNLALKAPRKEGAFPVLYYHETDGGHTWWRDDTWAGYKEEYHVIHMAWTSYWLLRWAEDLIPERKGEILQACQAFADFLARNQLESGCIPSWYNADLQPERVEFREFNAELGAPALFLSELYRMTGERRWLEVAEKAMAFMEREVLPRQRWADFETYISCSRKPFDFYDPFTAQNPQNNISTMFAAMAWLNLYKATGNAQNRERMTQALDYLLLTQQVWNHPGLEPKVLGGFTTQNTDAEWSDARQGYVANLLLEAYTLTGRQDYLERAVAAARSGFAVAPYENWAHMGYGGLHVMSGMHWGTGTVMTSVETMCEQLGDAYMNIARGHGVGFNACTVKNVMVEKNTIALDLEKAPVWQQALFIRFDGVQDDQEYEVMINGQRYGTVNGRALQREGIAYT